jgi:hypothetical protein
MKNILSGEKSAIDTYINVIHNNSGIIFIIHPPRENQAKNDSEVVFLFFTVILRLERLVSGRKDERYCEQPTGARQVRCRRNVHYSSRPRHVAKAPRDDVDKVVFCFLFDKAYSAG